MTKYGPITRKLVQKAVREGMATADAAATFKVPLLMVQKWTGKPLGAVGVAGDLWGGALEASDKPVRLGKERPEFAEIFAPRETVSTQDDKPEKRRILEVIGETEDFMVGPKVDHISEPVLAQVARVKVSSKSGRDVSAEDAAAAAPKARRGRPSEGSAEVLHVAQRLPDEPKASPLQDDQAGSISEAAENASPRASSSAGTLGPKAAAKVERAIRRRNDSVIWGTAWYLRQGRMSANVAARKASRMKSLQR